MAPTQQQHTPSASVDSNTIRDNSITSSCCNSNRSTTSSSSATNRYHSSSSTSITRSTNNSITNNSITNNSITNNSIINRLREAESGDEDHLLLPISCRGQFYHDAFFTEARQHFEEAVRDVLDHWGHRSTLGDDLTCYRKLRESNLAESSQAVTVTQDNNSHQVVMDVKDFLSGDVKVKVVDEDELVVEGSVEQRQEGSVSKKSFRRRFSFPGLVRPDDVTSTMSSDGILTIIVPKKETVVREAEVDINKVSSVTHSRESDVTLGDSSSVCNSATLNTTSSRMSNANRNKTYKTELTVQLGGEDEDKKASTDETTKSEDNNVDVTSSTDFSDFLLPISRKGLFFHDSFFEEARKDFEAAVKKVVDTWGESRVSDDMTCYRSLRERNLQEENQAVSLTEDHQSHKVVMDVRDFLSGDVKVKVVDEDELVVEGSVEQRQEGSVSKKSFRRRFSFPGLVKPEAITSTMSSDGVLTVIVPKKKPSSTTVNNDTVKDVTITSTQETAGKELSSSVTNVSRNVKQSSSVETLASSVDDEKVVSQKINQKSSNNRGSTTLSSSSVTEDIGVDKTFSQEQTQMEGWTADGDSWGLDSFLPICHKGLFFHDSFFQDVRQDFETAVQDVLTKFGKVRSSSDDLSLYRNLRECDLRDENQAVKVTENQHGHQVVIDVGDFMKGNVMVRVVGEGEVEVEGQMENEEGNLRSSKSFRRRFTLPGVVDMNDINAAVSSDGVLTITATKVSGRRTSHVMRTSQEQTSERSCSSKKESCQ
ncbi:uncharacterized protein [Panulirus ornatus]|uniref:uncharacterized protein n=1 Tax=Panulirus ornatus TaxID=150431 RepID=UPI003A8652B9